MASLFQTQSILRTCDCNWLSHAVCVQHDTGITHCPRPKVLGRFFDSAPVEDSIVETNAPEFVSIDDLDCSADQMNSAATIGCQNLTDEATINPADRCPAVANIDVSWCENLTDEAIIGLADRRPAITNIGQCELVVSWCENLTDEAIIGLGDRCPAITNISVSCCWNLTGAVTSLSCVPKGSVWVILIS